jgi:flagellar protein FlbD
VLRTKDGKMITLTRLNGPPFTLNADLIERIEATPDTVVLLTDGTRYVVSESVEQLVDAVRMFRASVVALAAHLRVATPPAPVLQVVPADEVKG